MTPRSRPTSRVAKLPGPIRSNRSGVRDAARDLPRLLEVHGPRLLTVARRLCGHEEDARDLVQEVFLVAARSWGSFRGESSPGTWLYSIAARSCKARLRRKGGLDRRMPALSQIAPWSEDRSSALSGPGASPLGRAERAEAEAGIHAAIMELPEHFRVAMVLKDMLELSVNDTAAALGIRPETVKTRVHRARLLLRKRMLSTLPLVPASRPAYQRRVCVDLLKAKMEALDAGRATPLGPELVCDRCRGVFAELDLVAGICAGLRRGALPASLRRKILREIGGGTKPAAKLAGTGKARRDTQG